MIRFKLLLKTIEIKRKINFYYTKIRKIKMKKTCFRATIVFAKKKKNFIAVYTIYYNNKLYIYYKFPSRLMGVK